MREIKPRAWSIDSECWCTRVDYDGYKEEWSGIVPVLAPDNLSKRIGEIEDTNIIVEFLTGLKDKNGKEIYEGDIVDYNDDGECIGVVKYDAPEFYLEADLEIHERMLLKGTPHQKVIGNIYDDSELLKNYWKKIK